MTEAMAGVALKPCPFCGGEAIEHRGPFLGGNGFWVSCAGRDCRVVPRSKAVTAEDATTRWNTRALPSPATDAGEVRKDPQWADDRDPMGDLAIKLAARASAIEEQEGRGEWTWREIAECAAEALGRSPPFADGVEAAAKAIPGIIAAAMREEWDEICNDTDCHPDDIEKVGRKTFYRARHWTAQIGEASAAAIRGLAR